MPLLDALRNDLDLEDPRFDCGLGQRGGCTVPLNGLAIRSWITPVAAVGNRAVTTLAGLGSRRNPHT